MTRTAKANPEQMQTNGVASLLYTQGVGCSIHPSPIVLSENGLGGKSEEEYSKDHRTGNRSGNRKPRFVTYFIQGETGGNIKIGKAISAERRLRDLQCGSPLKLVLLAVIRTNWEQSLHSRFRSARRHGEWFMPTQELAEFIERVPGSRKVIRADADSPAAAAQRAALQHCSGSWLPCCDFDGWTAAVTAGIADNCRGDRASSEDEPLDPEDAIEPNEPCCCEACAFNDAVEGLLDLNIYGCVWRPGMLCAVAPKPSTNIVRRSIVRAIGQLYGGFDTADISLNLIFVDDDGMVQEGDAFGAYLAAVNPGYIIPDQDVDEAFKATPPAPAPRREGVPS